MGDIPELRQARISLTPDLIQQHLGQRQGRRLSHIVGLDQVKKYIYILYIYMNSLIVSVLKLSFYTCEIY